MVLRIYQEYISTSNHKKIIESVIILIVDGSNLVSNAFMWPQGLDSWMSSLSHSTYTSEDFF